MPYLFESIKEFIKSLNEKQTDPELMQQMEDEVAELAAECPRCGKLENECVCQERDAFSTVNAFRAAPGIKKDKGKFS
jgi:hypothetical protein